ncbi:hypothetical protein SAMD00019534_123230 [Acytostelium subglobosum LB1]|uniref:hypothetical protein n=1 Tax=Acytostelium subglobosum LB1 TaxID=1410327 RepID=UPI000644D714|nr:hypothetical protein SAMD00019534_123230 [Acytostelium subglobosum LB1]GAM29147.1 hypothetical protein SAMD00019534_123230 [Acytostelium subglobosum LB1]|eukprot:XP_012747838.1 hypothetical protein SAMD00019534_123230 [Acytostelium subglobosum LB1]
MVDFTNTQKNYQAFKQLAEAQSTDQAKANTLLAQLKIALIQLATPSQTEHNDQVLKECVLARDILESAALYTVKQRDIKAFDRYYSQLTPYYNDYKKFIQPSAQQYSIIGLNLMKLLATNQTARFHADLELIPSDLHTNQFIRFPLLVEKSISEGSYQKVLVCRSQAPSEYYGIFVDLLSDTMKEDIANCIEKSFKYLTVTEAQKVLQINSVDQLNQYVQKRGWKVQGDRILFDSGPAQVEIPSIQLIRQTLQYAKELERIV